MNFLSLFVIYDDYVNIIKKSIFYQYIGVKKKYYR